MSECWAAYYGDALVLNDQEFEEFCRVYAKTNNIEPDALFEKLSVREFDFVQSKVPDKTFHISDILSDDCDGKCLIPFYWKGRPNVPDNNNGYIKRFFWREHDCYAVFADHDRYSVTDFSKQAYPSYEDFVQEFKDKLEKYLPDHFDWDSHLGCFSYAAYA